MRAAARLTFPVWANLVLRRHRPVVVAITGSVGKTSTKEMIAAVLMHPEARRYVGVVDKSPKSLNNETGLPLAVLRRTDHPITTNEYFRWLWRMPAVAMRTMQRPYPDLMILEVAIGLPGTVRRFAKIIRPTIAVVTTIGPAHLETFGSVEEIARQKSALIHDVPVDGLVILGSYNPHTAKMGSQTRAKVVYADGRGRELARNAAREVGRYFGLPDELIERALASAGSVEGRQNELRLEIPGIGALAVVDDAFNASPLSVEFGLDLLAARVAEGRRVAVLGTMAELGDQADAYHKAVGDYARPRVDLLIAVGEHARRYEADHWFASSTECAAQLPSILMEGDIVWVKGSKVAKMDWVVNSLRLLASGAAEA